MLSLTRLTKCYFNTSHVSINPVSSLSNFFVQLYFNTSHVSINRAQRLHTFQCSPISIHPMFLLIAMGFRIPFPVFVNFNTSHVSINLITSRDIYFVEEDFNTSHVSINLINNGRLPRINTISIHPMFLLIILAGQWNKLVFKISIHPMFLLILIRLRRKKLLSIISIHPMFLLIALGNQRSFRIFPNFNTSHVSINRMAAFMDGIFLNNFNTSHVSINRSKIRRTINSYKNFNTSHVSINLWHIFTVGHMAQISIHPMFLLIKNCLWNTLNW